MSWNQVIGQDRAKGVLQQAILQDRVAHAYLFHGPYGTGKRAAALAFARALQCRAVPYIGCRECADCSRIDRMIHPDVRVFMPTPNEMDSEEIVKRLAQLGANPYETVDFARKPTSKSANKKIQYAKSFVGAELRLSADFAAFEGKYKVVVLLDAEALGEETSNVFLKMLEEPGSRTVFLLLTDRPERMLPTILSRCQPVRFDPLSAEDIERALVEREGTPVNEAATAARLSDGSFSAARDLLHDELARAYRDGLMQFLRDVYSNKIDPVMAVVEEVSSQTRDQTKVFLGLLMILVRDLMLVRELGQDAPIVNVKDRESLVKFNMNLANARLEQMVDLIEDAWYLIVRNVKSTLVLTSLVAGIRASMYGERALPLVTPLAEQILADLD